MKIDEDRMIREHGNIAEFLRNTPYTSSMFHALKTKKSKYFNAKSATFKLYKYLLANGYILDATHE